MHTFNHCFPCGYGFNQTKKGEKAVNGPGERELIYFRHVFVRFVEGEESGIRNPECGIRNLFLLLFVENHFACTIFFVSLFLKIIEY